MFARSIEGTVMATGNALLNTSVSVPTRVLDDRGPASIYGGLIGQMIDDIDLRMSARPGADQIKHIPEDFTHHISVACGYFGLVIGFSAFGLLLTRLF